MDAEKNIRDAQRAWAQSNGLSFCSEGYVCDVEANLWKPLSARARDAFEKGAGSELSCHMRALHSSSALAANFFDYWTNRDKAPLLSALGVDADGVESLDFEAPFATGLRGTPPHIDIAIRLNSGFVVAVECKFTEHLERFNRGQSPSLARAISLLPTVCGFRRDCRSARRLPKNYVKHRYRFEFLDPWQLLKHALGLARQLEDPIQSLLFILQPPRREFGSP